MDRERDEELVRQFDFSRLNEEIYGSFTYKRGISIEPCRTALVLVDMQPSLTSPHVGQGKAFSRILKCDIDYFANRVQDLVLPNQGRLLEHFRASGMIIVYVVTWSETEDLSDMSPALQKTIRHWEEVLGEQVYRKWNEGMDIWPVIAPRKSELICQKRSASAFTSSTIDFCLRQANIQTVVLTGCNTNGCVFETAVVGKNLGYDFVLVNDATACFHPVLQNEAEAWFARHFGLVHTTDETLELLRMAEGGTRCE